MTTRLLFTTNNTPRCYDRNVWSPRQRTFSTSAGRFAIGWLFVTHDTVIQHHRDKHVSLHQIAYLRSVQTPRNRINLCKAIHPFP
jgi:hypothetical protein